MTANITGRSMTREELMPMMVEFCGMLKGDTVMDMPLTSTRLNTLAPMTLPSEREPWPFASEVIAGWFPPAVYYVAMISAVLGNGLVIYFNVLTARAMGRPDLMWAALLSPGYWFLMWLAALKAFVQLIIKPSYWEKTAHGLDEGDHAH